MKNIIMAITLTIVSLSSCFAITTDIDSQKIIEYAHANKLVTDKEYQTLKNVPLELNKKEKACVWEDMQNNTQLMDAITDCRGI
ncbi:MULTISPECIES: hypothetical protein [Pseudomonadota]|uniref:hypothetical protein n=1 Tax=Pseudomonadota TaxID=1224 RepID=UPI0008F9A702|nr:MULTISPECIES: hypothetical protein [Pseudomonadota]MBK2045715.1 hypothetical protein [Allofrancisella guangzhouensis]MRN60423.1 hypothetical protein [Brucella sp. 09RB8918]OIN85027.1 putative lipoprotein [Francisella sp. TX07-6608]TDT66941.1 hypothetical protein EDC55_1307 [Allofrancisella inopinata]